jgi:DNA-binding Lrp family transcriptional regulator
VVVLNDSSGGRRGRNNNNKTANPKEENKAIVTSLSKKIDELDRRIIGLLVLGYRNKQITAELKKPLSTIQRRTKRIIQRGLIIPKFEPNYKQLGLKKGLIHVYLENGDMRTVGEKISNMDGITSVSIHIGNSDIIGEYVYEDSEKIVDILSRIKELEGVDRTVWSEEVFLIPVNKQTASAPFRGLSAV